MPGAQYKKNMDSLTDFFNHLKEQESDHADLIDKIVAGISEDGFDNSTLENWIAQELKGINSEYKAEFEGDENDED